jgi:hypothetical protein
MDPLLITIWVYNKGDGGPQHKYKEMVAVNAFVRSVSQVFRGALGAFRAFGFDGCALLSRWSRL